MKDKFSIETEINRFLDSWGIEEMTNFMNEILPLVDLYHIDDEDWVSEIVGEENTTTVRIVRTVYLTSRIAEIFSGKFCTINIKHKNLWKKMEKEAQSVCNIEDMSNMKEAIS